MKKTVKNKKGGTTSGKMLAAGVGLALGAGAYYLLGPDGKKNQKKAKVLMAKMQKEIGVEIKKAKEMSGPLYQKAVDVISENYAKQYEMHAPEIKAFAKKLKGEWKKVSPKPAKKYTKSSKKKV